MSTQTATIPGLIEPTAVVPAEIARYVPPPQPQYLPAASPAVPGVVIAPDGTPYYGHAPIIYAQQQPLADPQAMARAVDRIGQGVQMIGGGAFAAGAGFGISEVIGAVAGAGTGALLAAAALIALGKLKGTRISTVTNVREEHHHQVANFATGMFGRATGGVSSEKSFTANYHS